MSAKSKMKPLAPKVMMNPKVNQLQALKAVVKKPQLSQRDTYAKAMNKAQKNGGSNGVGVGI